MEKTFVRGQCEHCGEAIAQNVSDMGELLHSCGKVTSNFDKAPRCPSKLHSRFLAIHLECKWCGEKVAPPVLGQKL